MFDCPARLALTFCQSVQEGMLNQHSRLFWAAGVLFFSLFTSTGAPPELRLTIAPPGITNEFSPTALLDWTGVPAVAYSVQSSTNLGDPNGWVTEDLTRAEGGH